MAAVRANRHPVPPSPPPGRPPAGYEGFAGWSVAPASAHAPSMPSLVVVIGPSGSGKSTVVRELYRRGVVRAIPTWTTRPRREDERAGSVEHRFISDAVFDALDARGFFDETATMPGLPYRYGLPHLPLGPGPAN